MPSFREMHRIKEIRVDVHAVPATSISSCFLGCHLLIYIFAIQTAWNQVKTNGYTKRYFLFLKENVCSGYSYEAALSNVNDSFTLSRLMKRPKTCCDPAHDENPQLTVFFVKYTESVSIMFKPI